MSKTFGCEDGQTLKKAAQSAHGVSILEMLKPAWARSILVQRPPSCIATGVGSFTVLQTTDRQIKLNLVLQARTLKIYPQTQHEKFMSIQEPASESNSHYQILRDIRVCNSSLPQVN